jgi:hypothetical protein
MQRPSEVTQRHDATTERGKAAAGYAPGFASTTEEFV